MAIKPAPNLLHWMGLLLPKTRTKLSQSKARGTIIMCITFSRHYISPKIILCVILRSSNVCTPVLLSITVLAFTNPRVLPAKFFVSVLMFPHSIKGAKQHAGKQPDIPTKNKTTRMNPNNSRHDHDRMISEGPCCLERSSSKQTT